MDGKQTTTAIAAGGFGTLGTGRLTSWYWNDLGPWLTSPVSNLPLPDMPMDIAGMHAMLLLGLLVWAAGFLPRNRQGDGPLPGPDA